MRLLKREKSGWVFSTYTFSLTTFSPRDMPSEYAILSHRWGPDEVTYKDIENGTAKTKAGYKKLEFCGERAARDGLSYFWIDTCCIDKTNSVELSEAINSMFKWYQNARKCYVYLPEVLTRPSAGDVAARDSWEVAFQKSEWFTRGWTLQELIAPAFVEFFSAEGTKLGDKRSLERQINQITGIPTEVLRGKLLSTVDEKERLSWTVRRQTTVEEDAVYCLLGLFDIHMPLIYGEGQQKALVRLQREIQQLSKSGPLVTTDAPWIVPFDRNSHFTGRESQLAELEKTLVAKDHTSRIAVTGLGGVGKTQLVLELLYRRKAKHKDCSIIWIPVTTMESLQQGYLTVAQRMEIPGCEDKKADVKKLVQDHLSKEDVGPWLLVFDNADDIDLWTTAPTQVHRDTDSTAQESSSGSRRLIDYLPKNKQGCIIFTTRDMKAAVKLASPQNIIRVPEMSGEAATQLLKKSLASPGLVDNDKDTLALVDALAYLPLAITQATAYINANGITLADYLSLLEDTEEDAIEILSEDFEDHGRYQSVKNPIAITWLISFERIRRSYPLAADYLSFIACVHPREIPESLLPPGSSRKKELDAIGTLTAYSFVSRRPVESSLDLHRLVYLATRNWLRKEDLLSQWTEKTIIRLAEVFPDNDYKNRTTWRTYFPHARQVLASDLVSADGVQRMTLMMRYATCLYSDGRWDEAEVMFTELLAMGRKMVNAKSSVTLRHMAWLASTYADQGRWQEAEQLGLQVFESRKTELGAEHLETLTSMANLASIYADQDRWDEAEQLEVQVFKIRKIKLGAEHPDTMLSMANLASTYRDQGRWDEAEQLKLQVLEMRKARLGADHPDTLTSMANLASTYADQGRWDEAEQLEVQVLEIEKINLGPDHPDTLVSMANLASTYRDQGRWDEAEQLKVQVLEMRKARLGADHPDTLLSMANLASSHRDQGRWKEAEQLEIQVLEMRRAKLGADHTDTLTSMANLASTYGEQGRLQEAEQLEVQVLETSKTRLGPDHPDTLTSMNNLASTYADQGRWQEAEPLWVQVYETRKIKLGPNHPFTLYSMRKLAFAWKELSQNAQAMQLLRDCFQRQTCVLGATHHSTLLSEDALAEWEDECSVTSTEIAAEEYGLTP